MLVPPLSPASVRWPHEHCQLSRHSWRFEDSYSNSSVVSGSGLNWARCPTTGDERIESAAQRHEGESRQ